MCDVDRGTVSFCTQPVPELSAASSEQWQDFWVESSLTGEGNIHLAVMVSLHTLSTLRIGRGRITLQLDALVLGGETTSLPLTR